MKNLLLFIITVLAPTFIKAQPCPTVTAINVTQPLCFGQSNGVISIDYTSGTPPYTISWAPIGPTYTTTLLSHTLTGIPAGTYFFNITDNNGCNTSQPVNVSQPPLVVLNVSPNQTICYGESAQIYASGSGGIAPYTYTWTPNIGSGPGPHMVNPNISSQYTITMSDNNGCSPTPKIITINVTPPLGLSAASYSVCQGDNVVLTPSITSPGNGGPYNFTWSNGVTQNGVTSSSISVISTMPTPNTYTVSIDDGCTVPSASAIFTLNVDVCTELTELTNQNYFSVYPNPSSDFIYIESNHKGEVLNIEIYDTVGRKVKHEFLINSNTPLNLENLPNGIYFLQIKTGNQIVCKKKIIKKG